ncbi:MAG: ABC transporter ATP-binding protein [Veillonellaceae bacterium]|nr:ABC transporter ATP-binding protein [Veillonellaceae bacterium]
MTPPIVEVRNVTKIYPLASGDVTALDDVSLVIEDGEFVAIMGPSGSGKSTLMNQLGCLDVPTKGKLLIAGADVRTLNDHDLTRLRLSTLGYIFQRYNLIPLLTAYENVEYPYILKNRKQDDTGRVLALLETVGITKKMSRHKPAELSGGQQQRVAIARALVNEPKILICDEPTGNLDTKTGLQIMSMLTGLNEKGNTIIMVTHNPEIAEYADRTVVIRDGRIAT